MSGDSQLRLGVLGVGRIGSMHVDLIANRTEGGTVTGVFDVHAAGARAVAERFGVTAFDSAEALIASDDVDAVAICTSTDTHVDLIVAAAEAGKAIFCEKPISLDLAEVDRGLAAVEAAGVPLHIGFNRRFDPGHRAVRDAVADGTVGDLRQIAITSRDPAPPPIGYIERSGGIFCDMTIHDFDMARYVAGSEVTEVFAKGWISVDQAIGDAGDYDTVTAMLTHENGVVTTIDNCRQSSYGYDQRVEAFGSSGAAISENHRDHYALTLTAEGGRSALVPNFFLERYIPSYVNQWNEFITAVTSGAPTPISGADGRAPLVMGLAAGRSVAEGRPVATTEID
ncbi:MAG: inositol 2-dehydrogenase [Acidimicrobiia bacterium]|nr:inositol 2-dehydrogenase [Acidimicrobiia bacterium]